MAYKPQEKGFTLIEIMIVVAILAGVTMMIAPRLSNPNSEIRSAVRKLGSLTRTLQTQSRLRMVTYRLAIQMSEKEGYKYWVESAPGEASVFSEAQEKQLSNLTTSDREKRKKPSGFRKDKSFPGESLPRHLKFQEVEIKGFQQTTTEGIAYIHFFPQGLAQESAIHLGDGKKLSWTIAIRPLTGQADVITENVRLKDLSQ